MDADCSEAAEKVKMHKKNCVTLDGQKLVFARRAERIFAKQHMSLANIDCIFIPPLSTSSNPWVTEIYRASLMFSGDYTVRVKLALVGSNRGVMPTEKEYKEEVPRVQEYCKRSPKDHFPAEDEYAAIRKFVDEVFPWFRFIIIGLQGGGKSTCLRTGG